MAGRPRLQKDLLTDTVGVRISKAEREQLEQLSQRHGSKPTTLLRVAVQRLLQEGQEGLNQIAGG